MKQKRITLRTDQAEFLSDHDHLSLAPMVRSALDDAMDDNDGEFPTGRRQGAETSKTVILLEESHHEFLAETEMNFSAFVGQVVDQRMEIERQLDQIDE
ncbi:hypothetical protein [Natrarchaeobaculum sulfurireducens]|uniref:Uncharacterized protein n=1 Tax=Natrarchaeobaculum sulfurireducens TaxID=2044521 RepID=A0A346PPS0_9EURY|nr:hypothetical protein [Natrarchaeobaculum sulfurireducens]AXR81515.1 hypothetical protein AArcMg_1502 [Natrarchaeobaculum sulfurireducens]